VLKKYILGILRFAIFLSIGIFFIWLFLRNLTIDEKQQIIKALKIADYSWIVLAIVLGMCSHYLRALRWRMLMEPMGFTPRRLNVYMAVLIAYLANLALPRLGEVSRCGILARYEKIPFNKSFGTVITERIVDMLSFVVLFFLMIFTMSDKLSLYVQQKIYEPLIAILDLSESTQTNLLWSVIGLTFAVVVFLIFIRSRIKTTKAFLKFHNLISGFFSGVYSLTKIRKPFTFLLYTISIWVLYFMMSYVVFFSLEETSSLLPEAGLAALVFGSVGIMIVQGGIGIYPAIIAETLFLFTIPSTTGYAMGWLIWSSQTIMILLAGVFSLILLNILNKKGHDYAGRDTKQDIESSAVGTDAEVMEFRTH
jgi:uncharacterized protein (TIRG00374 family)